MEHSYQLDNGKPLKALREGQENIVIRHLNSGIWIKDLLSLAVMPNMPSFLIHKTVVTIKSTTYGENENDRMQYAWLAPCLAYTKVR